MEDLLVDVPVFIIIAHFVALVGLLIQLGVIYLQRFVIHPTKPQPAEHLLAPPSSSLARSD